MASSAHAFWPDDIELTDPTRFDLSVLTSPKYLTDIYLLGLAVKNNGTLVTFDQGIPSQAVLGAGHLTVL